MSDWRVAALLAVGCAVFAACNRLSDVATDGEPDAGGPSENAAIDAEADARADALNASDAGEADADAEVALPPTAMPTFSPSPGSFDAPQ